jgi:uncharacterized membrane protein
MVQKKRHIAKAFTWRVVGTIDTFILAWLLTGSIELGAAFSGVEILTKTVLYYLHERAWYNFKWGVDKD